MQGGEFIVNKLNDMMYNPQFYEMVGVVLLIVSGIFSAFVSELLTKNKANKKRTQFFLSICYSIITLAILIIFTLLLLWIVFHRKKRNSQFC